MKLRLLLANSFGVGGDQAASDVGTHGRGKDNMSMSICLGSVSIAISTIPSKPLDSRYHTGL